MKLCSVRCSWTPLAVSALLVWSAACGQTTQPAETDSGGGFMPFDVQTTPDTAGADGGADASVKDTAVKDTSTKDGSADGAGDATAVTDAKTDGSSADGSGDGSGGDAADAKSDVPSNPCSPNPCTDENKTVCTVVSGKAQCACVMGYELQPDGTCDVKCTPPATKPAPQKGLKKGDLLITELMIWPIAVKDDVGEWFEVKNNSTKAIDLNGLTLAEETGTDLHVINGCTGKMTLQPGEVAVLGRNGDKLKNGGNIYKYVYTGMTFKNFTDSLIIKAVYTASQVEIDRVSWSSPTWPLADWKGAALSLDLTATTADSNDKVENWCASPNQLPSGDYGSPGDENPACPEPPDQDKDGVADVLDNCPIAFNPPEADGSQADKDGDTIGDACDNCPDAPNVDQANSDADPDGDACDAVVCGDGDLDQGEVCDDGNEFVGDGCDSCKPGVATPGNVVINEILAHTDNLDDSSAQWIELYNPTAAQISLKGWRIDVKNGVPGMAKSHTIADDIKINAKGYVVLAASTNNLFNGYLNAQYAFNKPGAAFMIDPKSDTVTLVNVANKKFVDSVDYSANTPAVKTNVSLQLDPKFATTVQNDTSLYWCYADAPIPNGAGNLGSPGKVNPTCTPPGKDIDGDTINNELDNCVYTVNVDQADQDKDLFGDLCDTCPKVSDSKQKDADADGVGDLCDNCPGLPNPTQADGDNDGFGDACDSPTCGNGLTDAAETCDDGNTAGGDGCSINCQTESFAPGQIVITEVMANPKGVDENAEWVELYNPGEMAVDINGWVLRDQGNNKFVLKSDKPLLVAPGAFFVVGSSADKALNGGAPVQLGWFVSAPSPFSIANVTPDDVIVEWNGKTIDSLAIIPKSFACNLQPVPPNCQNYGWPITEGKSVQLDPAFYDATKNDDFKNWCEGKEAYGTGDNIGSPGQANPPCINPCEGKPDNLSCGLGLVCLAGQCKPAPKCGDGVLNQASEECDDGNVADNDGCSGLCKKEAPPAPKGTLVISEVMVDPDAVSDSYGEWFEVYNPTIEPIDLSGWKIVADVNGHTVTAGAPGVPNPPVIAAKQYGVLIARADQAINNGLKVLYAWADQPLAGLFSLKDTKLPFKLKLVNPQGVTVDEIDYGALTWSKGASVMLKSDCLLPELNDQGSCWTAATPTCGYGLWVGLNSYATEPTLCKSNADCVSPSICQPLSSVVDGGKTLWKYDAVAGQLRCGARDRGTPNAASVCP